MPLAAGGRRLPGTAPARAEAKSQTLEARPAAGRTADLAAWADEEAVEPDPRQPGGQRPQVHARAAAASASAGGSDDGPGLPGGGGQRHRHPGAATCRAIFERFYRVDKARSRELGGTGLGLSIVKHLVQAMHGSVRAASKMGRGRRFFIQLPAAIYEVGVGVHEPGDRGT